MVRDRSGFVGRCTLHLPSSHIVKPARLSREALVGARLYCSAGELNSSGGACLEWIAWAERAQDTLRAFPQKITTMGLLSVGPTPGSMSIHR